MRIVAQGPSLAEVLSRWGHHEVARGKPGVLLPTPTESLGAMLDGIEVLLRHYSQLVARILVADPLGVVTAEFEQGEAGTLLPCNGRGQALPIVAQQWHAADSESGRLIRELVAAEKPVGGPFLCTARVTAEGGLGPIVIYEGTHRMAAWYFHRNKGLRYPILVDLIRTKGQDPVGPDA